MPLEKAVALKADGDEALVLLANCHLDRGTSTKALAAAQLAVAANPQNADAYLVIGAVQQQKNHIAEARTAYERISSSRRRASSPARSAPSWRTLQ